MELDPNFRYVQNGGVHPLAVIEDEPEVMEIAFTQSDVDALITILRSVGGCPIYSRRKFIDQTLGILNPMESDENKNRTDYQGTVWFIEK